MHKHSACCWLPMKTSRGGVARAMLFGVGGPPAARSDLPAPTPRPSQLQARLWCALRLPARPPSDRNRHRSRPAGERVDPAARRARGRPLHPVRAAQAAPPGRSLRRSGPRLQRVRRSESGLRAGALRGPAGDRGAGARPRGRDHRRLPPRRVRAPGARAGARWIPGAAGPQPPMGDGPWRAPGRGADRRALRRLQRRRSLRSGGVRAPPPPHGLRAAAVAFRSRGLPAGGYAVRHGRWRPRRVGAPHGGEARAHHGGAPHPPQGRLGDRHRGGRRARGADRQRDGFDEPLGLRPLGGGPPATTVPAIPRAVGNGHAARVLPVDRDQQPDPPRRDGRARVSRARRVVRHDAHRGSRPDARCAAVPYRGGRVPRSATPRVRRPEGALTVLLSTLDWIIIGAYAVVAVGTGLFFARRAGSNSDEFFLGGRSMPWWLLGTSMVATTFSTDTPNLVTDLVRTGGVSQNWLWWAFLLTGMLTVFFYAKLWRRSG